MKRKQNIRWNTMKILVIGFLSVIVLGAVLLWLPVSNEKPISFLDALFTSTTSVCVTGLVTVVPKSVYDNGKDNFIDSDSDRRSGHNCMYHSVFYAS